MDAGTAVASSEKPESSAAVFVPLPPAAMAKGEKAQVTSGDRLMMKHPEPAFTKVPPQVRQSDARLCFYVHAYCNVFLIGCTNSLKLALLVFFKSNVM